MNLIAWNKINNAPVIPERHPENLEWSYNKLTKTKKQYHEPPASPTELIPITVTNINGPNTRRVNADFTSASCYELKDIHISGHVAIPDNPSIEMTVKRDDGRLFFFEGEIKDGLFNIIFNFPTVGRFTYSDAEANFRIGTPTFTVKTLNITVMRNPSVPET